VDFELELEFTPRETDREWIPVEIKSAEPEIPGSNPGGPAELSLHPYTTDRGKKRYTQQY